VILDFHSMPHEALDSVARPGARRPEVVLGDRFGASARGDLVDALERRSCRRGWRSAATRPSPGPT
jgi:N-formylglutamate amidohydrolase